MEIEEVLTLSEDKLLEQLGKELFPFQAIPRTPQELQKIGQAWLYSNINIIKDKVCNSENVRSLVERQSDEQDLILVLADFISALSFGISPVVLSALLLKLGIKNLCSNLWIE